MYKGVLKVSKIIITAIKETTITIIYDKNFPKVKFDFGVYSTISDPFFSYLIDFFFSSSFLFFALDLLGLINLQFPLHEVLLILDERRCVQW